MRSSARAAALVATAVVGAVGGAATYAKLDNGNTTTIVRPTAAVSRTTSPAAVTSNDLSVNEIYKRARDGVVEITVTSQQQEFSGGSSAAQGSGFVYDTAGHVVTNQHVADGASSIKVRFANGKTYNATVVGSDASTDLAVLKVDAPTSALHPLTLGDSTQLEVGDGVVAIGSPFGLEETVTTGIVSALHREMTSPNNFTIANSIQTDAAINHGNSGGPLLNMRGQVIGVNAQIESDSGGNDGVGFAIPSSTVRSIVSQILATGTAKHAYLGVALDDSSSPLGAQIAQVNTGTPAATAGLQEGDVVTAVGDKSISSGDALRAAVESHSPGDTLDLTIVRNGNTEHVTVKLATRPGA
jgi:putative serine protease PepD